jgi:hypothetical protein
MREASGGWPCAGTHRASARSAAAPRLHAVVPAPGVKLPSTTRGPTPHPLPPNTPPQKDETGPVGKAMASGKCILQDGPEEPLLTFADEAVRNVVDKKATNATFHIEVEDGGWSILYFVSCEPAAAVSLSARLAQYNVRPDGSRDYLSVGLTELDAMYWWEAEGGGGLFPGGPGFRGDPQA